MKVLHVCEKFHNEMTFGDALSKKQLWLTWILKVFVIFSHITSQIACYRENLHICRTHVYVCYHFTDFLL